MAKGTKPICSCLLCGTTMTVNNLKIHHGSKRCVSGYTKNLKPYTCVHCNVDFSHLNRHVLANHVRWCIFNPKHDYFVKNASSNAKHMNNKCNQIRDISKMPEKISKLHKDGHYKNAYKQSIKTKIANGKLYPSEETRKKMSIGSRNSKHRRCSRRVCVFVDKNGRTFRFDSSWEVSLAIRLDALDIKWDRPPPIEYVLDGKIHNYFGDFYLPDYDLYLDPKNPLVRSRQEKKIEILSKKINLIILGTLKECENFVI